MSYTQNSNLNLTFKQLVFFSLPVNLSEITPKELKFKVLTDFKKQSIYQAMNITYRVSPLFKIPLKWVTKITQENQNRSITDFPLYGRYKYWNYFHEFTPNKE